MRSVVVWATGLVLLAASARAGVIRVPKDIPTVQQAVDTARPGDEIVISGGPYLELVNLTFKSDLTIRGDGKAVVSEMDILECSGLRLERLVLQGSSGSGLILWGCHDVVIRKCRLRDLGADGIYIKNSSAIVVEKNRISNVAGNGMRLGRAGYEVTTDCTFRKNRIRDAGRAGFYLWFARDSLFERNDVARCGGDGFLVEPGGTGNELTGNTLRSLGGSGFRVGDDGNALLGNEVSDVTGDGIALDAASSCEVTGNRVRTAGGAGIRVEGSDNAIVANRVKSAAAEGVHVAAGSANGLEENRVKRSGASGFRVDTSGNSFLRNRASRSAGFDLLDTAGGNEYVDNDFGTTGP